VGFTVNEPKAPIFSRRFFQAVRRFAIGVPLVSKPWENSGALVHEHHSNMNWQFINPKIKTRAVITKVGSWNDGHFFIVTGTMKQIMESTEMTATIAYGKVAKVLDNLRTRYNIYLVHLDVGLLNESDECRNKGT